VRSNFTEYYSGVCDKAGILVFSHHPPESLMPDLREWLVKKGGISGIFMEDMLQVRWGSPKEFNITQLPTTSSFRITPKSKVPIPSLDVILVST
jgi:hypothetical protein